MPAPGKVSQPKARVPIGLNNLKRVGNAPISNRTDRNVAAVAAAPLTPTGRSSRAREGSRRDPVPADTSGGAILSMRQQHHNSYAPAGLNLRSNARQDSSVRSPLMSEKTKLLQRVRSSPRSRHDADDDHYHCHPHPHAISDHTIPFASLVGGGS